MTACTTHYRNSLFIASLVMRALSWRVCARCTLRPSVRIEVIYSLTYFHVYSRLSQISSYQLFLLLFLQKSKAVLHFKSRMIHNKMPNHLRISLWDCCLEKRNCYHNIFRCCPDRPHHCSTPKLDCFPAHRWRVQTFMHHGTKYRDYLLRLWNCWVIFLVMKLHKTNVMAMETWMQDIWTRKKRNAGEKNLNGNDLRRMGIQIIKSFFYL